jgi:tRNA pseudouridine38-40 synthase
VNRLRNIQLIIAYDGTHYAGWQKQKKDPTIQGLLEGALTTMTSAPTVLHGAGRTDAGVHALAMVANFTTAANIPCPGFLKGLNSILPHDIRILAATETEMEFHARRSACAKTYVYNICNTLIQLPSERLYSAHIPGGLNIQAIKDSLQCILGSHDFSSFEASGSRDPEYTGGRGAVREIYSARLDHGEPAGRIRITITGDGFLRHMVRNIAGTLIQVGKGAITVHDFREILAAQNRSCAGPTAPAHGLFLKKVLYKLPTGPAAVKPQQPLTFDN